MKQDTAKEILEVARRMVRQRGYSAFSYADVARQVGIRKASIHYHFPAKDRLVTELVKQYREILQRKCLHIEQQAQSTQEQLEAFVDLYQDGLQEGQICLCGMLSADFAILNPEIQTELKAFFSATESWLGRLLERGLDEGIWVFSQSVELKAKIIIAMLQGAQLSARLAENKIAAFEEITKGSLSQILTA